MKAVYNKASIDNKIVHEIVLIGEKRFTLSADSIEDLLELFSYFSLPIGSCFETYNDYLIAKRSSLDDTI